MPLRSPLRTSRETTHTPQGDGNLAPQRSKHFAARNNPHPARGRKRLQCPCFADNTRNNPHPARGRKLTINQYRACIAGNNPHPARGRKPFVCVKLAVALEKQPTPRKGTETFPRRHFCNDRSGNNPHPARGRKLWRPSSPSDMILKQPTPRKGTETRCSRRSCRCNLETTHTPQGDGNKAGHIQIRLYLETTHTPQGDGNCHRQRVAAIQRKQPTPRKGTENHLCSHCRNCWRNHSHPRQGTTDKKRSVRHLESRKRARQLRLSAARHR